MCFNLWLVSLPSKFLLQNALDTLRWTRQTVCCNKLYKKWLIRLPSLSYRRFLGFVAFSLLSKLHINSLTVRLSELQTHLLSLFLRVFALKHTRMTSFLFRLPQDHNQIRLKLDDKITNVTNVNVPRRDELIFCLLRLFYSAFILFPLDMICAHNLITDDPILSETLHMARIKSIKAVTLSYCAYERSQFN